MSTWSVTEDIAMETTTKSYSQDFGEDDLNIVDQLSLDNVLEPNHHTIVNYFSYYIL